MERNIYKIGKELFITSNEEIKPNVYALINKVLCKTELLEGKIVSRQLVGGATMDICKSEYLEIILTTDDQLIKDGVQAIDEEFLKWVVKNPSCDFIRTLKVPYFDESSHSYLLDIPKEESKQETLEEVAEKYANKKGDIPTTKLEDAIFKQGFIDGAKWQQEQDKKLYNEEDLLNFGAFVRIEDKKEKRLFLIQDYYKKWFEQFSKLKNG